MKAADFSRRSVQPEIMDAEELDGETFGACMAYLAKVNRLTFAYRPTLRFFEELARSGRPSPKRAVSVLDVGSGSGDMLRAIHTWAARRWIRLDLTGLDRNPLSARVARQQTPSDRPIQFVTADVFDYRPAMPVDIVISSLFTHHLDPAMLARFIAWMEANAAIGWFVNDIRRHPIPYHLFAMATRALGFHRIVRHDGMVSIARSFDVADWRAALDGAGIPSGAARIVPFFPFRLCVARVKPA